MKTNARHCFVYSPYGYRPCGSTELGFNGEWRDRFTAWYFLGNGFRAFNSVLMRFNSVDTESPFAEGGVNSYAYCGGDPINRHDPTGHVFRQIVQRVKRAAIPTLSTSQRTVVQGTKNLPEYEPFAYHGSEASNKHSLVQGVSTVFSERQSMGPGFYVTKDPAHARRYADAAADRGHVYTVMKRSDVSFIPRVGFKVDPFGVIVINPNNFSLIKVVEELIPLKRIRQSDLKP